MSAEAGRFVLPPGYRLLHLPTVTSTSDIARQRIIDNPVQGSSPHLVILADRQTGGRGRDGRQWASPPGNLYATVLLRDTPVRADVPALSLGAAVAMGEAVALHLPNPAVIRYKWPNDLLLDGAKFCGLLLECGVDAAGRGWLAVGSGVNLRSHPAETAWPATHLEAHGFREGIAGLLAAYAARLDYWFDTWRRQGAGPLRDAWMASAAGLDGPMRARLADGQVLEGLFRGLDATGALLLDTASGRRVIHAGDVFPAVQQER